MQEEDKGHLQEKDKGQLQEKDKGQLQEKDKGQLQEFGIFLAGCGRIPTLQRVPFSAKFCSEMVRVMNTKVVDN